MGSLLVEVRQLVTSSLADLPEFADVETKMAYRVGSKRRERCWTRNPLFTHSPASMRATKTFRDEDGQFELVVFIEGVGQDQEWTSTRAMDVGHAAEDWIAIHASWDGALPGLNWIKVDGPGALTEAFNDKASLAELTYTITYRARLT